MIQLPRPRRRVRIDVDGQRRKDCAPSHEPAECVILGSIHSLVLSYKCKQPRSQPDSWGRVGFDFITTSISSRHVH